MDVFSRDERSRIMSRIRSRANATTELRLIQLFRRHKIIGWRRNQNLPGKPDFVFREKRMVVFVDEQKVPAWEEMDSYDETAEHFALLCDGSIVGTARIPKAIGYLAAARDLQPLQFPAEPMRIARPGRGMSVEP